MLSSLFVKSVAILQLDCDLTTDSSAKPLVVCAWGGGGEGQEKRRIFTSFLDDS